MKFSEQWLRAWVDPEVSRQDLVARLSMVGLEVDSVAPVAGDFTNVVVGEIVSTDQHPNADKLKVCRVSDGVEQYQVVCGAPNARGGLKVPFARIGAELPGELTIKQAKLRGVESQGMLCSAAELQVSEDHAGLLELPADAPVGADVRDYLDLDDATIELGLTPNRGDCLSIAGLAREVGAVYGAKVHRAVTVPVAATVQQCLPVEVFAPAACPHYLGRVISNVDAKQLTPRWMVERLRRSGIRSIDAVVDVTNYVMLELGQPMHAFDLAEIRGGVRVRMAQEGESLVLLDGRQVALQADTLVIADHERPLAIAGVMGGEHSGVAPTTRDLFLESAFFEPVALAGKARGYGLHTDASHRYERGVDPMLARVAMDRATSLLIEIVGGEPGPVVEVTSEPHLPQSTTIQLRSSRVAQVLGLSICDDVVERALRDLGFGVKVDSAGEWNVTVPTHRFDVALEIDLIEELGRLYGYDRLPVRYPSARLAPRARSEAQGGLPALRQLLVARGYQEAITFSFVDPELFAMFHPGTEPLTLANPIASDLSAMRASLWPGLIKALQHNLNRQQSRVRLFESGLRFEGQLANLRQEKVIAGLITGPRFPTSWAHSADPVDFYDIKGDVEALLGSNTAGANCRFEATNHPALHPGQAALVRRGDRQVGCLGALHPDLARKLDIAQPVFLFELVLSEALAATLPAFREMSRYPEVRRDLALLMPRELAVGDVLDVMRKSAGEYLTDLTIFDLYQGKGIDPLSKSLAVSLTWQHPSRTLNEEEVGGFSQSVLAAVEERFGAKLRT